MGKMLIKSIMSTQPKEVFEMDELRAKILVEQGQCEYVKDDKEQIIKSGDNRPRKSYTDAKEERFESTVKSK